MLPTRIRTPDDVLTAVERLHIEIEIYKQNIFRLINMNSTLDDAEEFICCSRTLIDSWRAQLIRISLFAKQRLQPKHEG